MRADVSNWFERSLDAAPDLSVLMAVATGQALAPRLDALAAHLALRELTWELIVMAADADVESPVEGLANAFFVERRATDDRLDPLRRASAQASGDRILLSGADLSVGIVHLDEITARLDGGADIVVGWPHPDAVVATTAGLPTFLACPSGVLRALGDTRSVYGGSTFVDAMQVAHFWGLDIDELQVDVAIADVTRPRVSIRPVGRVCAGPEGLDGLVGARTP